MKDSQSNEREVKKNKLTSAIKCPTTAITRSPLCRPKQIQQQKYQGTRNLSPSHPEVCSSIGSVHFLSNEGRSRERAAYSRRAYRATIGFPGRGRRVGGCCRFFLFRGRCRWLLSGRNKKIVFFVVFRSELSEDCRYHNLLRACLRS